MNGVTTPIVSLGTDMCMLSFSIKLNSEALESLAVWACLEVDPLDMPRTVITENTASSNIYHQLALNLK